jgi:hypothetical protein
VTDPLAPSDSGRPSGQSLLGWIAGRASPGRRQETQTRIAVLMDAWLMPTALLALWIAIATWGGARWLERAAIADRQAIEAGNLPNALARSIERLEHRTLAGLVTQPTAALTIEQLAAALPPDDRLISASIAADGSLAIEVLSLDPARLRAALRGARGTGSLRTRSERREDGAIRVTLATGRP